MTARESVLGRLTSSYGRFGAGCYGAILCMVTVAVLGIVGLATHQPWLFPSLGPTVLLFFESPKQRASRPGNTLAGHGIGLVIGIACFYAFGVDALGSAPTGGLQLAHVLAAVVSIAVTSLLLALIRRPHPPAGATTLILSLGILSTPAEFAVMAGAVVLVTALGWGLNLLLGTRPVGPSEPHEA